jgi:hypothetical protein
MERKLTFTPKWHLWYWVLFNKWIETKTKGDMQFDYNYEHGYY